MRLMRQIVPCASWMLGLVIGLAGTPSESSAAQRASSPSAETKCPKTGPRRILYVVDGLTGEITSIHGKGFLFPGDTVEVRVRPANLLHYAYEVTLDSIKVLVQSYGIVGFGRVNADSNLSKVGVDPGLWTPPSNVLDDVLKHLKGNQDFAVTMSTKTKGNLDQRRELIDSLRVLVRHLNADQGTIDSLAKIVSDLASRVLVQDSKLTAIVTDSCSAHWDSTYTTATSAFERDAKDVNPKLGAISKSVGILRARFNNTRLAVELFNADLQDKDTVLTLRLGQFPRIFDSLVTVLTAASQPIGDRLKAAAGKVERWKRVTAKDPEVRVVFPVTRASIRQYISVTRRPISDVSIAAVRALDAGASTTAAPAKETLVRVSYDAHGTAGFNLSMGVAGVYRRFKRTFDKVAVLRPDGRIEYKVAETSTDRFSAQPVVQLGIYRHPIDPLERSGPSFMATLGAQIAGSDRDYYLGAALDFRAGIQLGAGLGIYQATLLQGDWQVGQTIPVDATGAPLVSPPTRTVRRPGYYVYVGFRPAIFEVLGKAVGLIPK